MHALILALLVGFFYGLPHVLDTAAVPVGAFSRAADNGERRVANILFVGDLMYDRTIRREADLHGDNFIFSCIADALRDYDLVVANLEGPITSHASVSIDSVVGEPSNIRFTFPLRLPEVLAANNIRLVSLGNNHIYDFGLEGIAETRAALEAAGIAYAGDPTDPTNMSVQTKVNEIPIVLVPYNEFFGATVAETVAHIRAHAWDGFIVVFAHWGDEHVPASERQKAWAQEFVDAGADLIVGAHPHVIQESEMYNGVPVYYSLGNFIFDQYFRPEVMEGLTLDVVLTDEGIRSITERRVALSRDRRTCLVE